MTKGSFLISKEFGLSDLLDLTDLPLGVNGSIFLIMFCEREEPHWLTGIESLTFTSPGSFRFSLGHIIIYKQIVNE